MTLGTAQRVVALLGPVCVALPWIILYFGGLRIYLYVMVGFALIMAFLHRRELLIRLRNCRTTRSQRNDFIKRRPPIPVRLSTLR